MSACYHVHDRPGHPLVLRDLGPWDRWETITNAAESVVDDLVAKGLLPAGRRLFYYDSEGTLGELVVSEGRFARFAAATLRDIQ